MSFIDIKYLNQPCDTIDEKLILKEIDQLENAVNSFSKSTNWIKQACVPISAAIASLLSQKVLSFDRAMFVFFLLVLLSWLFDAYCFYFQRKLRKQMEGDFLRLSKTWLNERKPCKAVSRREALFDRSHIFYFIIFYGICFYFYRSCFENLIMYVLSKFYAS